MKNGSPNQKRTNPVQTSRQRDGRRGEELAAIFLSQQGFRVVEKNWHCRFGEIDLIVQRGHEVRFVEVKWRAGTMYGLPEESITSTKRAHLFRVVETWLQSHPEPAAYQIDVVTILVVKDQTAPEIRWIQGIEC